MKWISAIVHDLVLQCRHGWRMAHRMWKPDGHGVVARLHLISALVSSSVIIAALCMVTRVPAKRYAPGPRTAPLVVSVPEIPQPEPIDYSKPVREIPSRFPARKKMPARGEGATSRSIDQVSFNAKTDLVLVDDDRVWWESDNDKGDTENDHQVHRALETPLRRLIELVHAEGGTLKVQDSYRDQGIHSTRSLHKQGRAVDLTCDELGLERLAKLTWAAGFDWVYYEAPRKGGHHVHASVKP